MKNLAKVTDIPNAAVREAALLLRSYHQPVAKTNETQLSCPALRTGLVSGFTIKV
jgi:hypothetical protein